MRSRALGLYRRFDDFWFASVDPLPLGITRFLAGLMGFVMVLDLYMQRETWFSEDGFVPVRAAIAWWRYVGLDAESLRYLTEPWQQHLFFAALLGALLLTSLGLFTRLSCAAANLGLLVLQYRNAFIFSGSDTLLRLTLLYLLFSPCQAAFSLDRAWRSKPAPVRVPAWPMRLVAWQTCVMYGMALLFKLRTPAWREGRGVEMALQELQMRRFELPAMLAHGPVPIALNYLTLLIEALIPVAFVVPRLRRWVLGAGVALHLGIELTLKTALFGFVTLATYPAFLSGEELRSLFRIRKREVP